MHKIFAYNTKMYYFRAKIAKAKLYECEKECNSEKTLQL